MTKLSDTARVLLSRASQHPEHIAEAPGHLPRAARDAVVRSLLKNGLLAETLAPREHLVLAWRQDEDGAHIALRITEAGLRAIGVEVQEHEFAASDHPPAAEAAAQPSEAEREMPTVGQGESQAAPAPGASSGSGGTPEAPVPAPVGQRAAVPRRHALGDAAFVLLTAWDTEGRPGLDEAIEALRTVVAKPARSAREPGAPRKPRAGTKQESVLALLRRTEGASGPAIAEATGWAPHTVRGFLAGLAKKGIKVEVLDRVRQVGPGKDGAKGSYTVYRIAGAG